jgi:hypothetical protein
MTAIVYLGEILVASLLAIVLLAISHFRMSGGTALFVGGVVGWTLAEYLVHRFVLHDLAPSQHRLHHANPDESVLTIFWQIWVCFAVAYLIAGGAFVAGALIAYAWYLYCLTAPTMVPINCRYHCSSITRSITDLRPETTASARPFGTMYSGRCCADVQIRQSEQHPFTDRPFPTMAPNGHAA